MQKLNQLEKYLERVTDKRTSNFEYYFTKEKSTNNIKIEDDEEYIIYYAWKQKKNSILHRDWAQRKLPPFEVKQILDNPEHDTIIFHAGCLNCSSQYHYNIEKRCIKCCYFKSNWKKEDLSI